MIYSGQCIHDAGLRHEVSVTLMEPPPGCEGAHTPEFYRDTLKKILDEGIPYDSVCFKDASGTSIPQNVYQTIHLARQLLPKEINISFHTHETAGLGVFCCKAALAAGATQLDLSMSPVSGGTCQTDVVTMWHALRGTEYDLGIDINKMLNAEEVLKGCLQEYFVPPEAKTSDPLILFSPMPGGALTANTQMMRDNKILHKYGDVIKEMTDVVKKGGFGTSVTPVSQFYFQQAFNNVMFGKWKKIADGYGKMVLGYFGKTPLPPDSEIIKIAAEQLKLEPTTKNPIDINDEDPSKGTEAAKKMLKAAGITDLSDENIFIAATCKEKGIAFLNGEARLGVRKNVVLKEKKVKTEEAGGYTVSINDKKYSVVIDGNKATVNGKTFNIDIKEGVEVTGTAPTDKSQAATSDNKSVKAPMPGNVLKVDVKVGNSVSEGDQLLILEAMKMETPIKAPCNGVITSITVTQGDPVDAGQVLIWIN
ncbi:MAG: biotin/lipoyl-binding protein [Spirochaetes bacterium]|nr:biotin/lipoyl-binding protein [Spirochaetota bacterium]